MAAGRQRLTQPEKAGFLPGKRTVFPVQKRVFSRPNRLGRRTEWRPASQRLPRSLWDLTYRSAYQRCWKPIFSREFGFWKFGP